MLTTNYDLPVTTSNEIYKTSGTISTYFATGSMGVAESQVHPGSPFLNLGARDYQEYSPRIPAILDEKIREGDEAIAMYNTELERREQATGIVNVIGTANVLFDSKKQARLFREDVPLAIREFYTPCEDDHDFAAKLASLASLFEVPLDPLRRLVTAPQAEWRSIKLVEQWISTTAIIFDPDMITTWKNIVNLRNMTPIHATNRAGELMQILGFFGEPTLPPNYQRLWDSVLRRFYVSLREWHKILQSI